MKLGRIRISQIEISSWEELFSTVGGQGEQAQLRVVRALSPQRHLYLTYWTHHCPLTHPLAAPHASSQQMCSPFSTVKCFPATVNCRHFRTGGGSSVSRVLTAVREDEARRQTSTSQTFPSNVTPSSLFSKFQLLPSPSPWALKALCSPRKVSPGDRVCSKRR